MIVDITIVELNKRTLTCHRCTNPTQGKYAWPFYEDFIIGAGEPWQERGCFVSVCAHCFVELLNAEAQASSDPCEKCGEAVYGWVEQRCCDGLECGCMGLPVTPCWCEKCWEAWDADRRTHVADIQFEQAPADDLE